MRGARGALRDVLAVGRCECCGLFLTSSVWGALAVFAFATGIICGIAVLVPGAPAELRTVAAAAGWAMLLTAPLLSLRPTTEERRSGFWEILATSPTNVGSIVLAKYLAGMLALAVICAVGLGGPYIALETLARPDLGEAACAVVGVLLAGSVYLASGLFFGSIATSAATAYLAALFAWVITLIAIRSIAPVLPASQADFLFAADPVRRLEAFLGGNLDSSNILYFVCITGAFLMATAAVQSTEADRGTRKGATGVRIRLSLWVVGAFAVMSAVAAVAHAPSVRFSIDCTKSRAWELNGQTRKLVEELPEGWRVSWIAPVGGLDFEVGDQLADVLRSFEAAHRAPHEPYARIDPTATDSTEGAARYALWVADLIGRRRGSTEEMTQAVASALGELEMLAKFAGSASQRIGVVLDQIPPNCVDRKQLEQSRSALHALSSGAPVLIQTLRAMQLGRPDRALPDYSETAEALAANNRDWALQLGAFSNWLLGRSADEQAHPLVQELAQRERPELGVRARALLRSVDSLDVLQVDPLQEISAGLARGGGVIIESPDGIAFLDEASLTVNSADQGETVRFDRRFRMEQLLDGAIRSILDDQKPELIIVHSESQSMLTPGPDGTDCCAIADACHTARIAVREWRVTEEPRPIASDRTAWMIVPSRTVSVERDARERAFLEAASGLVSEGRPVFLSLGPSLRPLAGRSDPWSELANSLGARATTDAVIVDDIPVAQDRTERRTKVDVEVVPSQDPLARALADQRLSFSVAVPVQRLGSAVDGVSVEFLAAREGANRSIERDWRRRTPDPRSTTIVESPVSVAVSTTRRAADSQVVRGIVIGSPTWMTTGVVDAARSLGGGRDALLNPGNRELAVNGVLWLAGLDARMGNVGSGREAPRIGAISLRERLGWTAGLALGVPVASLLIGAIVRLWRTRS